MLAELGMHTRPGRIAERLGSPWLTQFASLRRCWELDRASQLDLARFGHPAYTGCAVHPSALDGVF